MIAPPERLTEAVCQLGESPLWSPSDRCLYFADIERGALLRYSPGGGVDVLREDCPGLGALTLDEDGQLLLFLRDGEIRSHPAGVRVAQVEAVAGTRFNDAFCDRSGRVYCGVMPAPGHRGRLVRLEAGRDPIEVADPLMPNGGGLSPDGRTAYFTDTLRRALYAAPFDEATGGLGSPRPFVRVPRALGVPDGLAIDRAGGVWSAGHGASAIVRYDPDGKETHRVALPTARPTGLAFGGDDLRSLFVATAHVDGEAGSGALYCIDTGFSGHPAPRSRLLK